VVARASIIAVFAAGCAHAPAPAPVHDDVVVRWASKGEFAIRRTPAAAGTTTVDAALPAHDGQLDPTLVGCPVDGPIELGYYRPVVDFVLAQGEIATVDTRLVEHASREIELAAGPSILVEPRRDVGELRVISGGRVLVYCLHVARSGATTTIVVDELRVRLRPT
jgi:hypothetical protein